MAVYSVDLVRYYDNSVVWVLKKILRGNVPACSLVMYFSFRKLASDGKIWLNLLYKFCFCHGIFAAAASVTRYYLMY